MRLPKIKGITLSETIIAFAIITTLFGIFLNLTYNYLIILNTAKERLIALSLANEGLELAIALRNKQFERGSSNWLGISNSGTYCLKFETSTGEIITTTDKCEVYRISNITFVRGIEYDIRNTTTFITSSVEFANQKVYLEGILINFAK